MATRQVLLRTGDARDVATVDALMIAAFRRRGVGRALLRAVIAEAQATGIADLHLEVREGNEAVRLYTEQGFAKVGERRNYYRGKTGQAFDAHTYRRAV